MQEVLVRAWRYHASFDPTLGTERTWLFGIARNVINDRTGKRSRPKLRLIAPEQTDEIRQTEEIERVTEAFVISDALDQLSTEHREAIVAAYYHGKTPTQVAMETGVAVGTAKSRLFYGLRALREALEEQGILR